MEGKLGLYQLLWQGRLSRLLTVRLCYDSHLMSILVGFHHRNEKTKRKFCENFLGCTPQIDGKMQCSFNEDAEMWWKIYRITQSSFCLLFCWFSPKFDRKMQRKFWKRPFYFGPYKTNFCRYSWLDIYQKLICLKRQHCCNASDWVGLL